VPGGTIAVVTPPSDGVLADASRRASRYPSLLAIRRKRKASGAATGRHHRGM
jgi:hypothetical protein